MKGLDLRKLSVSELILIGTCFMFYLLHATFSGLILTIMALIKTNVFYLKIIFLIVYIIYLFVFLQIFRIIYFMNMDLNKEKQERKEINSKQVKGGNENGRTKI